MEETLREEELLDLLTKAQPFVGTKPPVGAKHIGNVFYKQDWYMLYSRVERFGETVIYYETTADWERKIREDEAMRQWKRKNLHPWSW